MNGKSNRTDFVAIIVRPSTAWTGMALAVGYCPPSQLVGGHVPPVHPRFLHLCKKGLQDASLDTAPCVGLRKLFPKN